MKRLAVIDIGSNSVRLVVYDMTARPPSQQINNRVYCGLGRDLGKAHRLSLDGVRLALETLQEFHGILQTEKVDAVEVVATAALRDAEDGTDFIKTVRERFGFSVRVVSGEEEARLAALGVISLDPAAMGVVADFGGGSLELARVGHGDVGATASFPFGAFRVMALGEAAPEVLQRGLSSARHNFGGAQAFYMIGGSWRALAKCFLQDKGLSPDLYEKEVISPLEARSFCEKIESSPVADLVDLYRLDVRRASVLPVSALVLRQSLLALVPERVIVSGAGVRDGVAYNAMVRAEQT